MEFTVHPDPDAERLLEQLAAERDRRDPGALGPMGHLPNVARDAFVRGVGVLAAEYGLIGPVTPTRPRGPAIASRRVSVALELPNDDIESVTVLADARVAVLRTRDGDELALERATLERALAILDHEAARSVR